MSWFNKLNIKKKLSVSFGIVILITAILGYTAYNGIGTMQENTHRLYQNNTLGIAYISRIPTYFQEMRVQIRTLMYFAATKNATGADYSSDISNCESQAATLKEKIADFSKKYESTFNDQSDIDAHKALNAALDDYFFVIWKIPQRSQKQKPC